MKNAIFIVAMLGSLVACSERSAEPAGAAPAQPAATALQPPATDSWVGQWIGVEGTTLNIAGAAGDYDLTLHDMDGASITVKGRADGNLIRFERDGVAETLHAGNGEATGMKWLDGKSDCLIVREGEGFCRD